MRSIERLNSNITKQAYSKHSAIRTYEVHCTFSQSTFTKILFLLPRVAKTFPKSFSATRHNIHMYPYFLFAAIHHLKSSPTFSVRPCSSVGRVTADLFRRSWVRFPPRSKDFFFASCGSLFPLLGLTPSGLFMGLS